MAIIKYDEEDKRALLRAMDDHQLLLTIGRIMKGTKKFFSLPEIEQELRRRIALRKADKRDKTGLPD